MGFERYVAEGQFRYYYERSPDGIRAVYDRLLAGFMQYEKKIVVDGNAADVKRAFRLLKRDIPEVFFVRQIHISTKTKAGVNVTSMITPKYILNEEAVHSIFALLDEKYSSFLYSLRKFSDHEKIKRVHDLIINRVVYKDAENAYSHEAPGVLIYGIGVCEGISKCFKYLCDRLGIKSLYVHGHTDCGGENGHAWNMVEISGIFYHMDVTFDATIGESAVRYDYFLLSDEDISVNHTWKLHIPKAPCTRNYYKEKGLFFTGKKELVDFLKKAKLSSDQNVVFQIPRFKKNEDNEKAPDIVSNILGNYMTGGRFKRDRFRFTYNLKRMVFEIYTV